MASDMAVAIRQLIEEKGISEELVLKTIEDSLMAAYKRRYGTNENAVVRFRDNYDGVDIFAKKTIVAELDDPVLEIDLEEAQKLADGAEVGDILEIPIDTKEFDLHAVSLAKQTTRSSLKEISRDTQYAEYKSKVGEIIIGYYQRERNGNIYVDLGKIEAVFPKKFQSPREQYNVGDRIKAMIVDVTKGHMGAPQVVLSRTHTEFVQKILELEIPEIYDKTVEVFKIVRDAGYRTKIAVFTRRDDIDPVGACVGLKGMRIQAIIKELDGEKIDVLRYDADVKNFIANSLSPAEVRDVYILDEAKHTALVVVAENQLSVAIGKQGLNVRLANRLCDWSIDVKTEEQFAEMDFSGEHRRAASDLFAQEGDLSIVEGIDEVVLAKLAENGVSTIEQFAASAIEDLSARTGLSLKELNAVSELIGVSQDGGAQAGATAGEEEVYECPECGHAVTPEMDKCPNCGVELSFEYEE